MILWNFIADETFTVFGSLTVSSGVIEGLARDLYFAKWRQLFAEWIGKLYYASS